MSSGKKEDHRRLTNSLGNQLDWGAAFDSAIASLHAKSGFVRSRRNLSSCNTFAAWPMVSTSFASLLVLPIPLALAAPAPTLRAVDRRDGLLRTVSP